MAGDREVARLFPLGPRIPGFPERRSSPAATRALPAGFEVDWPSCAEIGVPRNRGPIFLADAKPRRPVPWTPRLSKEEPENSEASGPEDQGGHGALKGHRDY